LTALNYLLEEVQTRKEQIVNSIDVGEKVRNEINTRRFKDELFYYIRNEYGEGLCREVAFMVMERIDDDIEAFINSRVNKALAAAGVNLNNNNVWWKFQLTVFQVILSPSLVLLEFYLHC